jgi:alpha-beta hydrolase superfamily lysophospholipase
VKEEKVEFCSEGQKIVGKIYTPGIRNPPAIIIAHGYGGYFSFIEEMDVAKIFASDGFATLGFEFRNFMGKGLTLDGEVKDLKAAIDFMSKKFDKLFLLGESLGCLIITLLNDKRIKAVTFWSPALNTKKAVLEDLQENFNENILEEIKEKGFGTFNYRDGFRIVEKKFSEQINQNYIRLITKIKVPILVLRGTRDKTVERKDIEEVYERAKSEKKLIAIEDAGHVFKGNYKLTAIKFTVDWFNKRLK